MSAGSMPKSASPTSVRRAPIRPGKAEHLAAVDVEVDALEDALFAEVADRDQQIAAVGLALGEEVLTSRPTMSRMTCSWSPRRAAGWRSTCRRAGP